MTTEGTPPSPQTPPPNEKKTDPAPAEKPEAAAAKSDAAASAKPDAKAAPKPDSGGKPKTKTPWGRNLLFGLSLAGFVAGVLTAHLFAMKKPPLPAAFKPAENPYPDGIYAEGILESVQGSGSNSSVFPEVSGVIKTIFVVEGQEVEKGALLALLDDSVPRAQTDSLLASLKSSEKTLAKLEAAVAIDPRSVSRDALDTARQTAAAARGNYQAADSLLSKYKLKAGSGGVVMAINASRSSYVSPQGVYNPYTQGYDPVLTLGMAQGDLAVRCFVDEILLTRVPPPQEIKAQLAVRGSDLRIPLQFVRVQPLVSPKIELTDEKLEQVDVRVLPILFRFTKPSNVNLFPGELVDVYIGR
jgi:HlyD family secretion protein